MRCAAIRSPAPLPELVEKCYALGAFPSLWAVEGLPEAQWPIVEVSEGGDAQEGNEPVNELHVLTTFRREYS